MYYYVAKLKTLHKIYIYVFVEYKKSIITYYEKRDKDKSCDTMKVHKSNTSMGRAHLTVKGTHFVKVPTSLCNLQTVRCYQSNKMFSL